MLTVYFINTLLCNGIRYNFSVNSDVYTHISVYEPVYESIHAVLHLLSV